MSRISIKEIKKRYQENKETERKFKWTYYVRRPLSYYLAWPFLTLGISATGVTIFWLCLGVLGCFIIATGGYGNMILGTAFLELAVILDCVDGHIARFTRATHTGDIIDTWAGEILLVSSFFSIGIGLSRSPELISANRILPFSIDGTTILIIGALTSLASLSSWTTRLHWRTNSMKFSHELERNSSEPDSNIRSKKSLLIIDNLFHYSGALTMLMVVASMLAALDIFLVLIALIYAVYLLTIMHKIVQNARALDRATEKKDTVDDDANRNVDGGNSVIDDSE